MYLARKHALAHGKFAVGYQLVVQSFLSRGAMRSSRIALSICLLFSTQAYAQEWSARRVRAIGENEGLAFGRIAGIAWSPEGRLFVLDATESTVHVIAPDGKLERSFGKRGAGPGELSAYATDLLVSRGEIVVVDYGNRRMNLFNTNGVFARSRPLDITKGLALAWVPMRDRVVCLLKPLNLPMAQPTGGLAKHTILAFDPRTDAAPDTLLRLDLPLDNEVSLGSTMKITMNMRVPQLELAGDGVNRLLLAATDTYRIRVLNPEGQTTGWLKRDVARQRYSAGELARMKRAADSTMNAGITAGIAAGMRASGAAGQRIPKPEVEIKLPEYKPALRALVAGDRFVLVLRTTDPKQPSQWDILAYDGRLVGALTLPARFSARALHGDLLVGVEKNELDVESVAIYRLEPKR